MQMVSWLWMSVGLALAIGVSSVRATPASPATVASPQPALSTAAKAPPPAPAASPAAPDVVRQLAAIERRLAAKIDSAKPRFWQQSGPLLSSICTVLVALMGYVAMYVTQRSRMKFDSDAAHLNVVQQAKAKIMDLRSCQLYEFYAPMRALLKQSLVLREEFYAQLQQEAPPSVRFENRPEAKSSTGKSLYISVDGAEFRAFRLIDDLPLIAGRFSHLLSHVSEFVRIGDQIAVLIKDKVGLVRPESQDLADMLVAYLAHLSVLKKSLDRSLNPDRGAPVLGYSSIFPRGLDELLERDHNWLRQELSNWERNIEAWLKSAGVAIGGGAENRHGG